MSNKTSPDNIALLLALKTLIECMEDKKLLKIDEFSARLTHMYDMKAFNGINEDTRESLGFLIEMIMSKKNGTAKTKKRDKKTKLKVVDTTN